MRRDCSFVWELLFVLSCVFTVEGLNCFQCNAQDQGCDVLTVADTTSPYYLPCPNETYFCRKISQTILALEKTIVTRKCSWLSEYPKQTKCIKYDTQYKYETTCQCFQSACNSAHSIALSPIVLLLTVVLVIIVKNSICRRFVQNI